MNAILSSEIQAVVITCIEHGMKDHNSIYQQVLDTVPKALSNSEIEMFVYDMIEVLK